MTVKNKLEATEEVGLDVRMEVPQWMEGRCPAQHHLWDKENAIGPFVLNNHEFRHLIEHVVVNRYVEFELLVRESSPLMNRQSLRVFIHLRLRANYRVECWYSYSRQYQRSLNPVIIQWLRPTWWTY